jgi:hypothetical protein
MKPEIFMDDFERTVWGDAYYSVIGRALTFATRFDSSCRELNVLLGVKQNIYILESKEEIIKLVNRLHKLRLVQHISSIAGDENELKKILDKGRCGRNEIAHDLTRGLDRCIDTLPNKHINNLMDRLRNLIIELAEADRAVSLITSILTHEPLPSPEFLTKYPSLIEKWVMEKDEI